jgi:hypothetical protein
LDRSGPGTCCGQFGFDREKIAQILIKGAICGKTIVVASLVSRGGTDRKTGRPRSQTEGATLFSETRRRYLQHQLQRRGARLGLEHVGSPACA